MFLETFAMESNTFFEIKDGYKVSCVKMFFLDNILGSQYLFQTLQTSHTVKNSENRVKGKCFQKCLRWRAPVFSKCSKDIKSLV